MLKRLLLENFMAHKRTEFEFGPGLTVLTGPNNTGKSAVVEALRCLAQNPPPKHLIRHGADKARVEAEFEDGTRVAWVRKERYAMYELTKPGAEEPEEFYKFGRTPPDEILQVLRLPVIDVGDAQRGPVDVHLGNQRAPIFLIDRPGSAVASFFAASTESAHLLAMQNLLKGRMREKEVEKRSLESRIVRVESDLDQLAPLPGLSLEAERARELVERIGRLERQIPRLQDASQKIRRQRLERDKMRAALEISSGLKQGPALIPTEPLRQWLATRANLEASRGRKQKRSAALAPLVLPPEIADARALADIANRIAGLRRAVAALREKGRALTGLESPPDHRPPGELAGLAGRIRGLVRAREEKQARAAAISPLAEPPVLIDAADLEKTVRNMNKIKERAAILKARLEREEKELWAMRERITRILEQRRVCPLCGGDLDAAKFMGEE